MQEAVLEEEQKSQSLVSVFSFGEGFEHDGQHLDAEEGTADHSEYHADGADEGGEFKGVEDDFMHLSLNPDEFEVSGYAVLRS
jgi:hypothetical protein